MEPLYTFVDQFNYQPEIINNKNKSYKNYIVFGMGGSAISVSLLKTMFPDIKISLHNDYGLPTITDKSNTLLIFNSYSGNTEEILNGLEEALALGYHVACISKGGYLTKEAELFSLPHITLPEIGIEPRFSVGHQIIAILTLMRCYVEKEKLVSSSKQVRLDAVEHEAKKLADFIGIRSVVLYSSQSCYSICYATKAAINEGAKHPAFCNIFSEANHNELEGFGEISEHQKSEYIFVLFKSNKDNPRIQKRMQVFNDLYVEKSLSPYIVNINTDTVKDIIESLLFGYFLATHIAMNKKVDPYTTPTITEFKKRML